MIYIIILLAILLIGTFMLCLYAWLNNRELKTQVEVLKSFIDEVLTENSELTETNSHLNGDLTQMKWVARHRRLDSQDQVHSCLYGYIVVRHQSDSEVMRALLPPNVQLNPAQTERLAVVYRFEVDVMESSFDEGMIVVRRRDSQSTVHEFARALVELIGEPLSVNRVISPTPQTVERSRDTPS